MKYNRMTDEAMNARVDMTYRMFEADDAGEDATADLLLLLTSPTPAELNEEFAVISCEE